MLNAILNNLKQDLKEIIESFGVNDDFSVTLEMTKDDNFGDFSTSVPLRLAKILKRSPLVIAKAIEDKIDLRKNHLVKTEVAGAGYINFFFDYAYLAGIVCKINEDPNYGSSNYGENKSINIEFVSANPTGSLHVGHCRGAAFGDSLARIMEKAGYRPVREYYVNDGGNQIYNLGYSVYQRYRELYDLSCELTDDSYHGSEIIAIAKDIKAEVGDIYLAKPDFSYFSTYAVNKLLKCLKQDLDDFRVHFDVWFSEKSLYQTNAIVAFIADLSKTGNSYRQDGALWLKSTNYGDIKDRVLVKKDGSYTYLTPDICYHMDKLKRGYATLIDVFGADHHGYIERLKAGIKFAGGDDKKLEVHILQMVRVIQNKEEIKMSKRSGKAITMRDLIDEVGVDALRYLFIEKSLSTHMDLDLDLAIKESDENPVYYIQYAYARIQSLFRNFPGFVMTKSFDNIDLNKTKKLIKLLLNYPNTVTSAAVSRMPRRICQYLMNLAEALHVYYNEERIITADISATNERLTLLKAVSFVIKDALNLIGVGVKDVM